MRPFLHDSDPGHTEGRPYLYEPEGILSSDPDISCLTSSVGTINSCFRHRRVVTLTPEPAGNYHRLVQPVPDLLHPFQEVYAHVSLPAPTVTREFLLREARVVVPINVH